MVNRKVALYTFLSACIVGVVVLLLGTQAFPRTSEKAWRVLGDSRSPTKPLPSSTKTPPPHQTPHGHGHPVQQDADLPPATPAPRPISGDEVAQESQTWIYDYARDARNYGLSTQQCEAAFPLLYHEIDRAVEYRRRVGNITVEDVKIEWRPDGIMRVMIRNNQLYVIKARGVDRAFRPRALATLNTLNRAILAYAGKLPDVEFTLTTPDSALMSEHGNHTTLAYARKPEQESLWLMPDFGYWGWPGKGTRSYAEHQSILDEEEPPFLDKIPKLVWRGGLGNAGGELRRALIKQSEGQSWSDVQAVHWHNKELESNMLSMQEHCKYMFAAQTEGNTYSGRLKLLLNCNSVTISHKLRFLEHYTHLLQLDGPDQNYVQVSRQWTELPETMESLLGHESWLGHSGGNMSEAHRIATNSRQTFRERYLTGAAEACYWRAFVRGWASVQGFEPQRWVDARVGEGIGGKKPRGVPFEAFSIMEAIEWEVPPKGQRYLVVDESVEE